jgi:5,10-methenyltetrahydrofolate synthetase
MPEKRSDEPEADMLGHRSPIVPSEIWSDVVRWRKAERQRLVDQRLAIAVEFRKVESEKISLALNSVIGNVSGQIVSAYWPIRGEPDLRSWAARLIDAGGRMALPVVIQQGHPLEFRIWEPGDPLVRGVWNILVPSHGPAVQPDVVIAPVVGFDEKNFRLGYGGGFFDRTLAAMRRRPFAVGVGYQASKIQTIYPQQHDIPMDLIVTEESLSGNSKLTA